MSRFEIATVGDNCIDRYLPLGLATVGGNAVNVAVQLSRLGRRTAYFGAAGDDRNGRWVSARLADNGISLDHLRIVAGSTAFTNLDMDSAGDRIIAEEDFGVCSGYRPDGAEVDALGRARHVHLGWLDDGGALKRQLAAAGLPVSQDLAVNPGAESLAIAFASAGASRKRARELLQQAHGQGAALAVVTMGALGSIASNGTDVAETGIVEVAVVDTTGAGDTFIAAFIDTHLRGAGLGDCLAAGRDAAAATCLHLGGFPQQPEKFPDLTIKGRMA
jgi:fructoselysine 6-kinase